MTDTTKAISSDDIRISLECALGTIDESNWTLAQFSPHIRSLLDRLDSAERERDEAKAFARWFAHKVQAECPSANLCAEALPIAMHVARSVEIAQTKES